MNDLEQQARENSDHLVTRLRIIATDFVKGSSERDAIETAIAALRSQHDERERLRGGSGGREWTPKALLDWERDYSDPNLPAYSREDVKRILADWRASLDAPLMAARETEDDGAAIMGRLARALAKADPSSHLPRMAIDWLRSQGVHWKSHCPVPESWDDTPPAAPSGAEGDTLRTLLQERNHRTDGDLQALADRCLHLSRGDRDLIAMLSTAATPARPESTAGGGGEAQVVIEFPGIGAAGAFTVPNDGRLVLPEATMADLAHHFRQGYTAAPPLAEEYVSVPVRLPALAVSEIKDALEIEFGHYSPKARPLWARLLEIVAGLSIEQQEAINEKRAALAAPQRGEG